MWRRHGPGEETAGALLLVNGGGGVPGVDIGLGERGGVAAGAGGPGEEVLGLDESLLGVFAGAGPQRCGGGFGAHPGELVPEAELAQQPLVRVAGQGVQAAVHPAFVAGELPVGGRQGAAAGQQVTQVDGGVPPGRAARAWWVRGRRPVIRSPSRLRTWGVVEPAGGRRWGWVRRRGHRPAAAGRGMVAVAEDGGDGLGAGAGVAEPAGGQVAFVVAAQAGEVAGMPAQSQQMGAWSPGRRPGNARAVPQPGQAPRVSRAAGRQRLHR